MAASTGHDAVHVPTGRETYELLVHTAEVQVGCDQVQPLQDVSIDHLCDRSVLLKLNCSLNPQV